MLKPVLCILYVLLACYAYTTASDHNSKLQIKTYFVESFFNF